MKTPIKNELKRILKKGTDINVLKELAAKLPIHSTRVQGSEVYTNHFRRLRKAFSSNGRPGILMYLRRMQSN